MEFDRGVRRKILRARWAILWEGAWPVLAPAVMITGVFLILAGFDLAHYVSGWWHLLIVTGFAGALIAALVLGLRRLRWPTGETAERRLEIDSELAHRPLVAARDPLSSGNGDRNTVTLWRLHRIRMLEKLKSLRVGWPHPGLPARDPYALRGLILLLLVISLTAAGGDIGPRLARALSPTWPVAVGQDAVLEAWINPPSYTGLPPVHLTRKSETGSLIDRAGVRVPVRSELFIRVFGGSGAAQLEANGERNIAFKKIDRLNSELQTTLNKGTVIEVRQGGDRLARWSLDLIPDLPPNVTIGEKTGRSLRGSLILPVSANDDYGITQLSLQLTLAEGDRSAGAAADVVTKIDLGLPASSELTKTRKFRETYYNDLTAHPWAGLRVELQLNARDEIEQVGRSEPVTIVLPEREFKHPVARAIIEQRKAITREPKKRHKVRRALAAISKAPDAFDHDLTVYLALRSAIGRLYHGRGGKAIVEVRRLLWDTALRIEDGRLSLTERRLRQAQDGLMEALMRGADDKEIEQRLAELMRALNDFLQAMTEQALKQTESGEVPEFDENAERIQMEDFQKMLDRMRDLSKMGAKDAAMAMLRQLRSMLENLRAEPRAAQNNRNSLDNQAIGKLTDLMRQQQALMDKTFRQGGQQRNGERRQGEPRQGQQQGQQNGQQRGGKSSLAEQQEALRRQLGELMRRLGEGRGKIPDPLGRAERAMRDARKAIQGGNQQGAVNSQGNAIDQLAEGLRTMLSRGQGQPSEDGDGTAGNNTGDDPAGRPRQSGGADSSFVEIPSQSDMQRAREILNELRRRSGERTRPRDELDYIKRLIQPF